MACANQRIADVLQAEGQLLAAIPHLIGILSGHVYHFFTVVHPLMGAKRRLGAPGWMKRRLDGGENPNFMKPPSGSKKSMGNIYASFHITVIQYPLRYQPYAACDVSFDDSRRIFYHGRDSPVASWKRQTNQKHRREEKLARGKSPKRASRRKGKLRRALRRIRANQDKFRGSQPRTRVAVDSQFFRNRWGFTNCRLYDEKLVYQG